MRNLTDIRDLSVDETAELIEIAELLSRLERRDS